MYVHAYSNPNIDNCLRSVEVSYGRKGIGPQSTVLQVRLWLMSRIVDIRCHSCPGARLAQFDVYEIDVNRFVIPIFLSI